MVAVQTISTMNMLCAGTLFLAMLLEPAAAFSAGTALYVSQGLLWQRPQSRPSVTSRRLFAVSCCAAEPPESSLGTIAAIGGLVANPVVWVSLVSVKTTGGGLPAGPFGLIGQYSPLSFLVPIPILVIGRFLAGNMSLPLSTPV